MWHYKVITYLDKNANWICEIRDIDTNEVIFATIGNNIDDVFHRCVHGDI